MDGSEARPKQQKEAPQEPQKKECSPVKHHSIAINLDFENKMRAVFQKLVSTEQQGELYKL